MRRHTDELSSHDITLKSYASAEKMSISSIKQLFSELKRLLKHREQFFFTWKALNVSRFIQFYDWICTLSMLVKIYLFPTVKKKVE